MDDQLSSCVMGKHREGEHEEGERMKRRLNREDTSEKNVEDLKRLEGLPESLKSLESLEGSEGSKHPGKRLKYVKGLEDSEKRLDSQQALEGNMGDPRLSINQGDILVAVNFGVQDQLSLMFFDHEIMVDGLGIGYPCTKLSIFFDPGQIWIEELSKDEWNKFWFMSKHDQWKFFLLSKDAEWSKDAAGSTRETDGVHPGWKQWLLGIVAHLSDGEGSSQGVQKKIADLQPTVPQELCKTSTRTETKEPDHPADQNVKLKLKQKATENKESVLIVVMTFVSSNLPVTEPVSSDYAPAEFHDATILMDEGISFIKPMLTVEFWRNHGQEELRVQASLKWGFGINQGWFQDDLVYSFRRVQPDRSYTDDNQSLRYSQILSERMWTDCEVKSHGGATKGDKTEKSFQGTTTGGFQSYFQMGASGGAGSSSTSEATESRDTSYTRKLHVLSAYPAFAIHDHSLGHRMQFRASFWEKKYPSLDFHSHDQNLPQGLASTLHLDVEAGYELYGEEKHLYRLEMSKLLTRRKEKGESVGAAGDQQERRLQILRKDIRINYDFKAFFDMYKKPFPYAWKIKSVGDTSPVPLALDLA